MSAGSGDAEASDRRPLQPHFPKKINFIRDIALLRRRQTTQTKITPIQIS